MTYTNDDFGTYEFLVFDDAYDCDPIDRFAETCTLGEAIVTANRIAGMAYEVDIWAGGLLVANVSASEAHMFGSYVAA